MADNNLTNNKNTDSRRKWLGKIMNYSNSLTASWLSYGFLFMASILISAFYLQSFFYLVTILLICLPIFSYNLTKHAFARLEPDIAYITRMDSTTALSISINNPSRLPISAAEFSLHTESTLYGNREDIIHALSLGVGNGSRLILPLTINKYGIYTASIYELKVYDYLHLFSFTKEVSAETSYTRFPDTDPKEEVTDMISQEGFDEYSDTIRRGNTTGNVTDIREYQPGDRLSRIHWKLTEKLDKLIVKESEATSSNEFTVLLELYQPSKEECDRLYINSDGQNTEAYNLLDDNIREAYAVSLAFINAGQPFIFMYYNSKEGDFVSLRVTSRDDLVDIMTQAFYSGSYSTKDLALDIYERAGLNKGTLVHIA
ncbi:MAG: DUF58 domain-containing protein [Lachnospiraceae bacterium]|nr:DUF58 domain-containing protein [Lachnospiraceae bacterium]